METARPVFIQFGRTEIKLFFIDILAERDKKEKKKKTLKILIYSVVMEIRVHHTRPSLWTVDSVSIF